MIKAIETRYKGYRFRSRLEARWAVFFDALGLAWEYEPEGFDLGEAGWYLPDFRVTYPGQRKGEEEKWWFEVKGDLKGISQDEWKKLLAFDSALGLLVLDGMPEPRMYCAPNNLIKWVGADGAETWPLEAGETDRVATPALPYSASSEALAPIRFGWALWSSKGRPWWDEHENYFTPTTYFGLDNALEFASDKAKQARFGKGGRG